MTITRTSFGIQVSASCYSWNTSKHIGGQDSLVGMVSVAAGLTPQHAVLAAFFLAANSKGIPVKD